MKIYIPHLHYTVKVLPAKKPPEDTLNAKAWVVNDGKYGCRLYTTPRPNPGDLAHELVHVLQFICLERNIDFRTEQEHMGYIMQYLMGKILGYKWER